jgi:hypothetical protein
MILSGERVMRTRWLRRLTMQCPYDSLCTRMRSIHQLGFQTASHAANSLGLIW